MTSIDEHWMGMIVRYYITPRHDGTLQTNAFSYIWETQQSKYPTREAGHKNACSAEQAIFQPARFLSSKVDFFCMPAALGLSRPWGCNCRAGPTLPQTAGSTS